MCSPSLNVFPIAYHCFCFIIVISFVNILTHDFQGMETNNESELPPFVVVFHIPGEDDLLQESYRCNFCYFASDCWREMGHHASTHLFKCSLCHYQTFMQHQLLKHKMTVHADHRCRHQLYAIRHNESQKSRISKFDRQTSSFSQLFTPVPNPNISPRGNPSGVENPTLPRYDSSEPSPIGSAGEPQLPCLHTPTSKDSDCLDCDLGRPSPGGEGISQLQSPQEFIVASETFDSISSLEEDECTDDSRETELKLQYIKVNEHQTSLHSGLRRLKAPTVHRADVSSHASNGVVSGIRVSRCYSKVDVIAEEAAFCIADQVSPPLVAKPASQLRVLTECEYSLAELLTPLEFCEPVSPIHCALPNVSQQRITRRRRPAQDSHLECATVAEPMMVYTIPTDPLRVEISSEPGDIPKSTRSYAMRFLSSI